MPHKIDSAISVYYPLDEVAADGSRLYLRIPRAMADQVKPVRLDGARRRYASPALAA